MTNPNNAVGTNGAFGGRTSVNAFNDGLAAYSRGIMSGWVCTPDSGLTVTLGGDGNTRDVAIAEDNAGNKTTINNISGSPVAVTLSNAPNNNSRIDAIVAYVNNPPTGSSTATDNYGACGLIAVQGAVASSPSAPTDSAIRTAITADGASGTTAYYVVLATITIASGTTSITSSNIQSGSKAGLNPANFGATKWMTTQNITWRNSSNTTVGTTVCRMFPLDGDGLTLCAVSGTAWANNSSGQGVLNVTGRWATPPKSIVGATVNAYFTGDTGSYKTYGEVSSSIDIWINKTAPGTRSIRVQMLCLAYF